MKKKYTASVTYQQEIAPQIFDMWISTGMAEQIRPGQFIGIYPANAATLLPRPISVCEVDQDKIRVVYRVAGAGTAEFSTYRPGTPISIMGPLGNGFPLDYGQGKKVFLIGGGIGIPPLLELAEELDAQKAIVVGYRDKALFLADDLSRYGTLYVATEDGSAGTKGNVMDAIRENCLEADIIYACGPMPMLRAVKAYAASHNIPAYISLEEHMACGVGACLGCVVKTRQQDQHSHVHNARICTEGPVFEAGEVDI